MSSKPSKYDEYELDPTFVHARREAIVIFCLWATGLAWAVPFCWFTGYAHRFAPHEVIPTTLGIPTWLFWGIFAPWVVADIFTIWFCFFYMKDDDLGESNEEPDAMAQAAKKEGPA